MREFLSVTNALSDGNRLRLFLSLSQQELCVCSLVDLIGLADSTVSKHMSILKEAGLVESRKCGRWVYYRMANRSESPLIGDAIEFARKHLLTDRVIIADAHRVSELHCKNSLTTCDVEPAKTKAVNATAALETL